MSGFNPEIRSSQSSSTHGAGVSPSSRLSKTDKATSQLAASHLQDTPSAQPSTSRSLSTHTATPRSGLGAALSSLAEKLSSVFNGFLARNFPDTFGPQAQETKAVAKLAKQRESLVQEGRSIEKTLANQPPKKQYETQANYAKKYESFTQNLARLSEQHPDNSSIKGLSTEGLLPPENHALWDIQTPTRHISTLETQMKESIKDTKNPQGYSKVNITTQKQYRETYTRNYRKAANSLRAFEEKHGVNPALRERLQACNPTQDNFFPNTKQEKASKEVDPRLAYQQATARARSKSIFGKDRPSRYGE
ncbi:MAG: hypothetical protein JSS62_05365 [Verrucomicrobia bacterium]|nr:hypothetical protein [Verrucomicrobiota bacterium]MBS0647274.1 hypothetical protein [Verrucomicrobiota bacterium]